jgi:ribonuclease D
MPDPAPRHRRDELPSPSKDEIAAMAPFERLGLDRIHLAATRDSAERALALLAGTEVLGFDTESKPTFTRGEVSDGPHIVQLATREWAVIFQLHDPHSRDAAAQVLQDPRVLKAGFGLGDDRKRIVSKLGIEPRGIVDLNADFRRLGHRREMGVRGAIALLFGKRFLKSGKAATSNWSLTTLDASQLMYAANDAWAALRVHEALAARGELAPIHPHAPAAHSRTRDPG